LAKEMTITEGLQEIKTIGKRLEVKRESLMQYVARSNQLKDPLEREGGSVEFIRRERQAIKDLELRIIELRHQIQHINMCTMLELHGTNNSIDRWLTWRREISKGQRDFLFKLSNGIKGLRNEQSKWGIKTVDASQLTTAGDNDIVVSVNEKELIAEQDTLEKLIGDLDGKLSLLNATTSL
jgi:hypothetical protein